MPDLATQHRIDRFAASLVGTVLWMVTVAWVAFQLQQEGIAPAVLFPLLVGAILGAGEAAICRKTGVPSRRWAIGTAVAWGLLVVIGQDYIGHRHHVRLCDEALSRHESPLVVMAAGDESLRPGFSDFLAGKVRAAPWWWGLDLALTSGASAAAVALGTSRKPSFTSEA